MPRGTLPSTKASSSSCVANRYRFSSISGKKVSHKTSDLMRVRRIWLQRGCWIAILYICAPPITNTRGVRDGSMALKASSMLLTKIVGVDGSPLVIHTLKRVYSCHSGAFLFDIHVIRRIPGNNNIEPIREWTESGRNGFPCHSSHDDSVPAGRTVEITRHMCCDMFKEGHVLWDPPW